MNVDAQPTSTLVSLVVDDLVAQVERDVGVDVATALRQRVIEGVTLQHLAETARVSREMIRQRLKLAQEAITIRWSEGAGLLLAVAIRLGLTADAGTLAVLKRILNDGFGCSMSAVVLGGEMREEKPDAQHSHRIRKRSEAGSLFPDPEDPELFINGLIVDLLDHGDK
jgi:hypothetical protein